MTATEVRPAPAAGAPQQRRLGERLRGRNNEGIVALAIVLVVIIVGAIHNSFWSVATIFSILHDSYEPLVFALGVLLILLIGGIDVSFDAIGIFAGYSVSVMLSHGSLGQNIWLSFLVAGLIGIVLGGVNALLVGLFRLPVLIVTLGTRGLFAGVLLTYIGSNYINNLPNSVTNFGDLNLATVHDGRQTVGLQMLIIPIAVGCMLMSYLLRRTVTGRGIYAIGGGAESARRAGFSVVRIRALVFCLAGMLAGLAGMIHVSLIGYGNPQDLVGNELTVIAAVVLGGASIFGGRGSVVGTVLGVLLIQVIQDSLISLGVQSAWDNVAIGLLLLFGMVLQIAKYGRLDLARFRLRSRRLATEDVK